RLPPVSSPQGKGAGVAVVGMNLMAGGTPNASPKAIGSRSRKAIETYIKYDPKGFPAAVQTRET
ncbi:MAG: hypothetical protein ACPIOQ_20340, partial [Promethearchaeia archaeon]